MSRDERIVARLIGALDSLMPSWCTIAIAGGQVVVAVEGIPDACIDLAAGEGAPDRDALLAFNVLSTIQDVIVRSSKQPWPSAVQRTDLPYPAAAVRQGRLLAWFGPEADPTVAIAPIDLATA
jgi:hypothetical protein